MCSSDNRTVALPLTAGTFYSRHRICPGRHLGSSIVWLAAACILATCDVLKAKDDNGNIIEPGMELESAITAYGVAVILQIPFLTDLLWSFAFVGVLRHSNVQLNLVRRILRNWSSKAPLTLNTSVCKWIEWFNYSPKLSLCFPFSNLFALLLSSFSFMQHHRCISQPFVEVFVVINLVQKLRIAENSVSLVLFGHFQEIASATLKLDDPTHCGNSRYG